MSCIGKPKQHLKHHNGANVSNITMVSSGLNGTDEPSELNYTIRPGGSNTTMRSGGDYPNPNMIQVVSFPWYIASGSFYSQLYTDTAFSPFREYYITSGTPIVDGIISNLAKFDIERTPTIVSTVQV